MGLNGRYKYIDEIEVKRLFCLALVVIFLTGCGSVSSAEDAAAGTTDEGEGQGTSAFANVQELSEENSDIFAWIRIPDTNIDYPLLQSGDGDDDFYKTHNAMGQEDPKGALYIEAANLKDMCDFNEVVHGSSIDEKSMFGGLKLFLDRTYFEEHQYIHVYMKGNALVYCIVAAFQRENTRLLSQYDFSYASGCQEFIDEIYGGRSMTKNLREGWEEGLGPEHFLITLTTEDVHDPGKQIVVIGCLVGDITGKIDRVIDWSEPESESW